MFSFFIGLIGVLTALIGWFGYKSLTLLVVGTALYFVETLLEWKSLNANAKKLDIIIFIVGSIIALFINLPFYIGGMLALNFYSALMTLISLPGVVSQIFLLISLLFRKWLTGEAQRSPVFLCFQKRNVFINRCPAQIAHPWQFGDIELAAFICGIMPKEDCGDAVLGCLRSSKPRRCFTRMRSQVRVLLSPPYRKNPNYFPVGNGFGFLLDIKDITYWARVPGFALRITRGFVHSTKDSSFCTIAVPTTRRTAYGNSVHSRWRLLYSRPDATGRTPPHAFLGEAPVTDIYWFSHRTPWRHSEVPLRG